MGRVLVFLRNAWFLVFMLLLAGGIVYGFVLFLGGDGTTTTMAGPTTTPASLAAAPSVIPPTTPPLPATPPYHDLPTTTVPTYVPGTQVIAASTPAAIATRQAMITPTRVRANPTTTPTPAEVLTVMVPGKDFGVTTPGSAMVVSGTWGSGPGQFGKGPESSGPASFDVDAKGNVHIIDTINKRVERFDRNGGYVGSFPVGIGAEEIAVAEDGSIYVLDAYDQHKIFRFGADGTLIQEYPIAGEIDLITPRGMSVRGQDVFVETLGPQQDPSKRIFQVVRGGQLLSEAEQIASAWAKRPTRTGGLEVAAEVGADHQEVSIALGRDKGPDAKIRVLVERPAAFVDELEVDNSGILYAAIYSIYQSSANERALGQLTVVAFTQGGEYRGKVEMPTGYETQVRRRVRVTGDGQVYQMHTSSEGLRVFRWALAD